LKATAFGVGAGGELVQGLMGKQHFHLSCPVNLASKVTVSLGAEQATFPMWLYPKTALAIKKVLALKGLENEPFTFKVERNFPAGKGLASSTADITAAALAAASLIGLKLTEKQLAKLAASIEPTDGTIFKEIVVFDHKKGELLFKAGSPPPLKITYFDRGGTVATLAYDKKRFYDLSSQKQSEKILNLALEALQKKDWELLGWATTLSVLLHKHQIPERLLAALLELKKKTKAYGLIMAHSGTLIGLLHEPWLDLGNQAPWVWQQSNFQSDPDCKFTPCEQKQGCFPPLQISSHLELQMGARANYDFAWG